MAEKFPGLLRPGFVRAGALGSSESDSPQFPEIPLLR